MKPGLCWAFAWEAIALQRLQVSALKLGATEINPRLEKKIASGCLVFMKIPFFACSFHLDKKIKSKLESIWGLMALLGALLFMLFILIVFCFSSSSQK